MGNFRYRMAQFLMGRNGFDNFCRGLLFLAMILIIADILCRAAYFACWDSLFWYIHISGLFPRILPGVRPKKCLVHIMCRPRSVHMSRDRKHYKYFKCPTCKQVLRAPKGRGG